MVGLPACLPSGLLQVRARPAPANSAAPFGGRVGQAMALEVQGQGLGLQARHVHRKKNASIVVLGLQY